MERMSYYDKNIKFDRQALTEVYELLQSYEDSIDEIPEKYMWLIEDNRDKDYIFPLDDLENIDLKEDTKKILAYLYTNFLSTPEERTLLKQLEKIQYEARKRKQYENINIFETKKENEKPIQDLHPVIKIKENIFIKIINFFKKIFRRE